MKTVQIKLTTNELSLAEQDFGCPSHTRGFADYFRLYWKQHRECINPTKMKPTIKQKIEDEALRRFPKDEYDDEYFTGRYYFEEGAKYGYNIKESVNDKLDFYAMDLNTERIKTYTALSERYNLDISSIRDIFDAGLNFAAGKYEQQLKQ